MVHLQQEKDDFTRIDYESFTGHPGQKSRCIAGRFAAYFLRESDAPNGGEIKTFNGTSRGST